MILFCLDLFLVFDRFRRAGGIEYESVSVCIVVDLYFWFFVDDVI